MATASCSNDDEALAPNAGYTAVQQKALTILNGTWVSNEVKVSYDMGGSSVTMEVFPSDSLVFLSQFPAPQSFYAYDYLQGKETESFVACGTCERYTIGAVWGESSPACYYYVTPSGDALHLYNVESELPVKSYAFRAESATRFYAGVAYNTPIVFNKK
ncbi:MAG: hypothetical protein IJ426_03105 [Clostridia bacterium]|nr:hypothetical protein [Clostridia bacterium]MBQ8550309.1 hypothetical protein [Clostridia bacterium]